MEAKNLRLQTAHAAGNDGYVEIEESRTYMRALQPAGSAALARSWEVRDHRHHSWFQIVQTNVSEVKQSECLAGPHELYAAFDVAAARLCPAMHLAQHAVAEFSKSKFKLAACRTLVLRQRTSVCALII